MTMTVYSQLGDKEAKAVWSEQMAFNRKLSDLLRDWRVVVPCLARATGRSRPRREAYAQLAPEPSPSPFHAGAELLVAKAFPPAGHVRLYRYLEAKGWQEGACTGAWVRWRLSAL